MKRLPCLSINLSALKTNAHVIASICEKNGITLCGVVKFSDGDTEVAKAYAAGGCKQIAVSRAMHLKQIKEAVPECETLLTRTPPRCDIEATAKYADLSLHSDKDVLRALNDAAEKANTTPGIILMLDVGDLREGVDSIDALTELAAYTEKNLRHLRIRGVGTNLACLNGVLPCEENLSFLVKGACAVERTIGRKLDFISGGSSINTLLLQDGRNKMPERINHLRIGGMIANPINIRINRGIQFEGMREDSVMLTAEIVEIAEKNSAPKNTSAKNWAGEIIKTEDKGRRMRAILAIGEQDIGHPDYLIPMEEGVQIVGGSSDHTIVDVTEAKKIYKTGDALHFRLKYAAMLYAFTGQHVEIEYLSD